MNLNETIKKLLTELQAKQMIGSGAYKKVFPLKSNPNYIVKQITSTAYFDIIESEVKFYNEYPDLFANIVKVNYDRGYVIQEKLNTIEFKNKIKQIKVKDERFLDYYIQARDVFNEISDKVVDGDPNTIYDVFKQDDFLDQLVSFFKKIRNIDLKKIKPEAAWFDLHIGNLGLDEMGNIKLLDL